ncbi:MAG: hypothetical protein K6U04_13345 [Armatimonadetes bacterium]|nr:hypothetical protein [Armatimonadota bacterium]
MRPPRKAQVQRCFWWVCRVLGYIVLGAAGLAVASPVLLALLFLLALLLSVVLFVFGALAGLAAIAACILQCLVGLPFWFWMIFTGFGALLLGIGLLGSFFSGGGDDPDLAGKAPPSRSTCTPWPWLLAALLVSGWWGEHNGE